LSIATTSTGTWPVARFEGRGEELFGIGAEKASGHRPVEDQGRRDPALFEPGDEGRGFPMAMGRLGDRTLGRRAAAIAPGHVGGGRGLVDEREALGSHEALPGAPAAALRGDIRPVLLSRFQRSFF
jgi:hypothetical protein